jgi:hypothetical protein
MTVATRRTRLQHALHIGLVSSLAMWLAVFAPLLCQYHGLMWHPEWHREPSAATEPLITDAADRAWADADSELRLASNAHHHQHDHAQHVAMLASRVATESQPTVGVASPLAPTPCVDSAACLVLSAESTDPLIGTLGLSGLARLQDIPLSPALSATTLHSRPPSSTLLIMNLLTIAPPLTEWRSAQPTRYTHLRPESQVLPLQFGTQPPSPPPRIALHSI